MRTGGRRRDTARALCVLLLGGATAAALYAWEPPVEPPRVRQSFLTAVYAPSFGLLAPSSYPLLDTFSVDGGWVNLFPRANNLNFYYGIGHSISELPLFSGSAPASESYDLAEQSLDKLYGKATYVLLDYLQLTAGIEYARNRLVSNVAGYEDYDYDRLTLSQSLSWDLRYSSVEDYYKGKLFRYPEQGFRVSGGLRENHYSPAGSSPTGPSWSPQAFADAQLLLHPQRFWVIALEGSGEADISTSAPRAEYATSSVLGANQAAGDYALDANLELRFLHPAGLFWESPAFWYISSFLFKFSPGFVLGYDVGAAGLYRDGSAIFQQSLYASPLVSIRMNGELETVLRADFCVASSGRYKVQLTLAIGTVGTGKTTAVLQNGIR